MPNYICPQSLEYRAFLSALSISAVKRRLLISFSSFSMSSYPGLCYTFPNPVQAFGSGSQICCFFGFSIKAKASLCFLSTSCDHSSSFLKISDVLAFNYLNYLLQDFRYSCKLMFLNLESSSSQFFLSWKDYQQVDS